MNANGQLNRFVAVSKLSTKGFTLIELIIVMALFMGVIIISSQAFNKILSMSTQLTKSSESDTQGVIGLEMLRIDIEHAGYGMPWLLSFPAAFDEVDSTIADLTPGINTQDFNDTNMAEPARTTDPNMVPRPVQAAASTVNGRDYLVIKSVMAGMNETDKKWTYVNGVGGTLKIWGVNDLVASERVVTIDSRTKRLVSLLPPTNNTSYVTGNPADFSYTITSAGMTPTAAFQPQQDTDFFVVYGVSKATDLRAPYNRVDYFVKRPTTASDIPARCAPGTGILYKAVMNHNDHGDLTSYPLVECIADMQVVFNVAADGVNGVDVDQSGLAGLSAKEIRQQLKMIKIYLVAHEGGKDNGFSYSSETITVGEGSGRILNLKNDVVGSDEYKKYRWKIYKLVVIPKNINY